MPPTHCPPIPMVVGGSFFRTEPVGSPAHAPNPPPRKLGLEGIVSKRRDSPYSSGRSRHWIKSKNPNAPAVRREAEEEWGR
jgi:hypothetical protein